ncbi:MAG: FAD-dependent oxidoreductase [Methylotenera sp.]|nr:FAD-dependent oxidoreductase [Oligoflexia bacterium]
MSLAYDLSKRGIAVTDIDKGEIGFGCSYGNAGWLTPCFSMPLPMPGMLLKSIGWMLDPVGPLHIKPQPSVLLARWLSRFLVSMNTGLMNRSVSALTEISKYSLDAYAQLDRDYPNTIGFERKGLLMVAHTKAGVKATLKEMNLVAEHGVPGRELDAEGIRNLEPALKGNLLGGVYFPEEAHAEPLAIVKTLTAAAIKNGVQVIPHTEVISFVVDGRKIKGVNTTKGVITSDQYVLATGSWSAKIGKSLNLNVPILGGKGYSIIVKPFNPTPKIPIMILERKIAVTPRKDTVRLAGTLELVNLDESITQKRVDTIIKGSQEFLNVPQNPEIIEVWRGLRPCTPDGVPIIGRPADYDNLFLATGHQMLGLQSAMGSARLAADLLTGTKPIFDPNPFRATRF